MFPRGLQLHIWLRTTSRSILPPAPPDGSGQRSLRQFHRQIDIFPALTPGSQSSRGLIDITVSGAYISFGNDLVSRLIQWHIGCKTAHFPYFPVSDDLAKISVKGHTFALVFLPHQTKKLQLAEQENFCQTSPAFRSFIFKWEIHYVKITSMPRKNIWHNWFNIIVEIIFSRKSFSFSAHYIVCFIF